MTLDPLHEALAALALGLPEARQVALAGGGALLAHDLISRPTQDIDLFTPDPAELARVTEALTAALRDRGYAVDVTRRVDTFAHLDVASPDGRAMAVELAVDARIRDTVQLSFGPVLHPDEIAADKTLALFGRAAARDLADVDALAARYAHDRLLELAAERALGSTGVSSPTPWAPRPPNPTSCTTGSASTTPSSLRCASARRSGAPASAPAPPTPRPAPWSLSGRHSRTGGAASSGTKPMPRGERGPAPGRDNTAAMTTTGGTQARPCSSAASTRRGPAPPQHRPAAVPPPARTRNRADPEQDGDHPRHAPRWAVCVSPSAVQLNHVSSRAGQFPLTNG